MSNSSSDAALKWFLESAEDYLGLADHRLAEGEQLAENRGEEFPATHDVRERIRKVREELEEIKCDFQTRENEKDA